MTIRSTAIHQQDASFTIGPRLRAARLAQGLTLQQVADAANVTKGYLSRLERDDISPTVGTLVNLCKTLGVDPGALLTIEQVEVVSFGSVIVGSNEAQGIRHSLLSPASNKLLSLTHTTMEPGASAGEELYPMFCESQTAYVLKGKIRIQFSNKVVDLNAGDAITFPGREPHTYHNLDGSKSAELIWVMVPSVGR